MPGVRTLYTDAATDIADTSFTGNGRVVAESGSFTFQDVGICWIEGTTGDPGTEEGPLGDEIHTDGPWTINPGIPPTHVDFTGSCSSLTKGTSYRVAFFATIDGGGYLIYYYGPTITVTTTGGISSGGFLFLLGV